MCAAPGVKVLDLWHGVPPQDVRTGAVLLPRLWASFPEGTVHVVVVDPGVGTDRAALAVAWRGRLLVGPDNGIFTRALEEGGEARLLGIPGGAVLSRTFHGRDLFAPAGARLAAGTLTWEELEPPRKEPLRLELPSWTGGAGGGARGEIFYCDPFGNLVSTIPAEALGPGRGRVEILGRAVPLVETYGAVPKGALLALVNSFGLLEVACRDGSARKVLGAGEGTVVRFLPGEGEGAG